MKFNFKLSEDAPTQHLAILVLGGVFTFLNLLEFWHTPTAEEKAGAAVMPTYTYSVDEETGKVVQKETKWENPQMAWYETFLCRGFKRSAACSFRLLHPFKSDFDAYGVSVDESAPKTDHVVRYRGTIKRNMILSDTIEVPDETGVN